MKNKKLVFSIVMVAILASALIYVFKKPSGFLKEKSLSPIPPSSLPIKDSSAGQQDLATQPGTIKKASSSQKEFLGQLPIDQQTNQIEIEQLKKLTNENSKVIYAKMKSDEIKSLKESIVNDEKLLQMIETKGSGIEDYKYIEKNLTARKKRLKTLLQKK